MKFFDINKKISIAGSKSILNRIIILTTFGNKSIKIINWSRCNDIQTMKKNLSLLGYNFKIKDQDCVITPPLKLQNNVTLKIEDSATGFRFLLTRLAFEAGLKSTIRLSEQLANRPHQQLVKVLHSMGADIGVKGNEYLINGVDFKGGKVQVPGNISSQFISSLLLTAAGKEQEIIIESTSDQVSISYIDLTIDMLKFFGINTVKKEQTYRISAGQIFTIPDFIKVEPDFSSAAFWLILDLFNRGKIVVENLRRTSIQPDSAIISILQKLSREFLANGSEPNIAESIGERLVLEMKSNPDLVPILTVACIFRRGKTRLEGISHLRYKESNRLDKLAEELRKIGVTILTGEDFIEVGPLMKDPDPVILNTYGDHRLVMAFTLLKMIYPQVKLSETVSVNKSYPEFYRDLAEIGFAYLMN